MIHIIKGGRGTPPDCILLEFNLRSVFGERFFPPMETPQNILPGELYVSHIRISAQDLAFELQKLCGIKKYIICGFTSKYHLENVLHALNALQLEIFLVMDYLSIMDAPHINPYLLELKNTYGVKLCLAGDFSQIILQNNTSHPSHT